MCCFVICHGVGLVFVMCGFVGKFNGKFLWLFNFSTNMMASCCVPVIFRTGRTKEISWLLLTNCDCTFVSTFSTLKAQPTRRHAVDSSINEYNQELQLGEGKNQKKFGKNSSEKTWKNYPPKTYPIYYPQLD